MKPNHELESAINGCILMDAKNVLPLITPIVSKEDFSGAENRNIFSAALELYYSNRPVDAVTVLSVVGNEYKPLIVAAAEATPYIGHSEEYARQLHEHGQKTRASEKTIELLNNLEDGESTQTCQEIAGEVIKCFDSNSEKNTVSAEDGFLNFCDRQDNPKTYIQTGFSLLDKYLFLDRGDFVIIGGRPSAGKTAFTLQIMLSMSRAYNVAYFSLETKPEKIFDRLISNYNGISFNNIKSSNLSQSAWDRITGSFADFKKLKFSIVKAAGMTTEQIKSKALQLHADVIFVDYLTLIRNPAKTIFEKATAISMGLHEIAQNCNIAVVALSQLNRDGKNAPDMTSLRDSGQTEQDADAILLIDTKDEPEERELIIAKNKEGKTGRIKIHFDGDMQKFYEVDNRY